MIPTFGSEFSLLSNILRAIISCFLDAIFKGFSNSGLKKSDKTKHIVLFFMTLLKYSMAKEISVFFSFASKANTCLIILRI